MSESEQTKPERDVLRTKLIIIGSGPAALTAAIYASRAELSPILFEGDFNDGMLPGGQLMTTTDVENFPGFPEGINGFELVERMKQQAEKYGTKMYGERIDRVDFNQHPLQLESQSYQILADAVIIATGANANRLEFVGSEKYWNKGISACAVCDGASPIFRNKPLVVIGGGDSAMEEAIFLTKFASKVMIVYRGTPETIKASKYMHSKAVKNPKIEFIYSTVVIEATGGDLLESATLQTTTINGDSKSTSTSQIECRGIFFAVGHTPNTSVFSKFLALDEKKYIKTAPNSTQTNIEGVFACGDVQDSKWRQAITAAGSGCMSALEAEHFLNK